MRSASDGFMHVGVMRVVIRVRRIVMVLVLVWLLVVGLRLMVLLRLPSSVLVLVVVIFGSGNMTVCCDVDDDIECDVVVVGDVRFRVVMLWTLGMAVSVLLVALLL